MPMALIRRLSLLLSLLAAAGALDAQSEEERKIKDRQDALSTALKASKTPADLMTVAEGFLALADEAVAQNQYELALKLLDQAQKVATTAKDTTFAARVAARGVDVKSLQKEHAKAKAAFKSLTDNPDDPEANLLVGRFLCFHKHEWELGIRNLAKGSDKALKPVAEMDLATSSEGKNQLEAGHAWWTLGERKGPDQAILRSRAVYWYEKAWPSLDKVERLTIRQRVQEAQRRSAKETRTEGAAGWQGADPKMLHLSEMYAHTGQRSFFLQRLPEAKTELVLSQTVQIVPGESYVVKFRVLTEGEVTGVLRLLPDKFAEFPKDRPFWTLLTYEFVAPPAATTLPAQFILYSSGNDHSGRVWVDDVQVLKAGTTRNLLSNSSFEDK
jgi:hypothetical protein